jgi:hypothetical protein
VLPADPRAADRHPHRRARTTRLGSGRPRTTWRTCDFGSCRPSFGVPSQIELNVWYSFSLAADAWTAWSSARASKKRPAHGVRASGCAGTGPIYWWFGRLEFVVRSGTHSAAASGVVLPVSQQAGVLPAQVDDRADTRGNSTWRIRCLRLIRDAAVDGWSEAIVGVARPPVPTRH